MMNNQSNEILAECSDEEGQNGARLQDPFLLTPSVDIAKALFNQFAVEGPDALINQIQCIKRPPPQQHPNFTMKTELELHPS